MTPGTNPGHGLRVVFDHQIFSRQQYGGVSRYFYELARGINATEGCSSRLIAPLHINAYLKQNNVPIMGFAVPKLPKSGLAMRTFNDLMSPSLTQISRPNILHYTYYFKRPAPSAGCPTVVTVFDMIHEKFAHMFPKDDPTSKLKRAAVEYADHVTCISERTRNDLLELFGVPREKTSVIHLGFTLSQKSGRSLPTEIGSKPFILFVGNREGHKNFKTLLRAYGQSAKLKEAVNLVCFGADGFSASEKSLILDQHLEAGQVIQVEGSDSVLSALYRNARLFVYPSLYEGFGIPPLEAMSFDCPVACSNAGSIPEVVGNAGMFFDPKDADSIGLTLESLLDSPDKQSELVARGRRRISQFSWQRCVEQTLSMYRRISGD